ncbi:MAG: 50S ribosomal protein L18, partial [Pseudomonadota bacterium]|nr:50S ribosomal protein L18 [Pseudomonadota bacterium]
MSDKKQSRLRRARRARAKINELGATRLCVNRTPRHIYAQIIAAEGDKVVATASTLEKDLRA